MRRQFACARRLLSCPDDLAARRDDRRGSRLAAKQTPESLCEKWTCQAEPSGRRKLSWRERERERERETAELDWSRVVACWRAHSHRRQGRPVRNPGSQFIQFILVGGASTVAALQWRRTPD